MGQYAVDVQQGIVGSPLETYRTALSIRRDQLGEGALEWLDWGADLLAFSRGDGFICVANFSSQTLPLPVKHQVLVASEAVSGSGLPANSAAWIRTF